MIFSARFGKGRKMHRRKRVWVAGEILPNLIHSKHKDWRQHPRQGVGNLMQSCLCGTASVAPRGIGIQTVFDDVEITSRKRYRREVVKQVIDRVKLVSLISLHHLAGNRVQLSQRPTVNLEHFVWGNAVIGRIKTVDVTKRKADRITQ